MGGFVSRGVIGACQLIVLSAFLVCGGMSALSFGADQALAATPLPVSLFPGSDGLIEPQAVAVDQATGDVYTIDLGEGSVDKFDSAGRPVAFSASQSYISANQLTGTPSEGFAFDHPSAAAVAVDNSGGPFNGDIYVTDSLHHVVDVFASSGTYLGQLNGSGTPQSSFTEPCGVAVDSSGRVYVGDFGGFVERYVHSASSFPVTDGDYTVSEISGLGEVCAVAVNAAGDLFASTWPTGPLNKFEHSQFPASGSAVGVPTLVDAASQAVAVDPGTGHVYVDEGARIAEYKISEGKPILVETFGSLSASSYGVAVNGSSNTIYVSDEGARPNPTVEVFGTPHPLAPVVVSESTANVTSNSAYIQAQLNPDFADTAYHFQYGTTQSYGAEAPLPDTDIGSAGGPAGVQSVTIHLQHLLPDTIYHYRVVAKNPSGTTEGSDATFTTQPPGGPFVLPDGRAWEMVSPLDKNSSIITAIDGLPGPSSGGVIQAEEAGESITYASNGTFEKPVGAPLSGQYFSKRSVTGWSTANITPPLRSGAYGSVGDGGPYKAFSSDLSIGLLYNGEPPIVSPPLTSDAPPGYQNYYARDNLTGGLQPVLTETLLKSAPSIEPPSSFKLRLQGVTPDLTHIVFSTSAALIPNAIDNGKPNLYEWANGQLQLVNILPGETHGTPGAVLGEDHTGEPDGLRPISDSGSIVYFTDSGNLYARENGTSTVRVDASQEGLESGGGLFQIASSKGSRVFFTDNLKLTKNSTGSTGNSDLYEYNVESNHLSDLTVQDSRGAGVQSVLGASEDGSYVYFVANGVLTPGASRGHCRAGNVNIEGFRTCNLYVWHDGTTKFIAALSKDDNSEQSKAQPENAGAADDWAPDIANRTTRITPDGAYITFMSDRSLTGYDNRNTKTGQREQEVYVYNASSGVLSCASCNPTRARPLGPSSIPGGTQFQNPIAIYQSRLLFDEGGREGRLFFDSSDAIVPQDTNGKQDVYEWEEEGTGNCRRPGGCVSLISSGTSSAESSFVDASAKGKDVFFLTQAELVPQDTDQLVDLYDAREGGGLPSPTTSPSSCEREGCRPSPSQAPIFGAPASATAIGFGNLLVPKAKPAVKHKPKRKGRRQRRRHKTKHRTMKTRKTGKRSR